ncbi:MAG TPA: dihydrodipicolinate synthase family protein [Rhizomicrobium sp.]|nr:dihydrodipicolinate synthase family protein [Rhizomicrobium sp.]
MREIARRAFLQWTAALGAAALASTRVGAAETAKPLRGIFPIAWSPCTPDNVLDLNAMAAQTVFCNRGGVAGLAWPQNASGWMALTDKERFAGAEAMLSAGRGGKTALMIGVQSIGADIPASIRFARHAAAHGADAVISLPPEGKSDEAIIDYYKAIGAATELPLMVQAVGDMSVELVVRMAEEIPTLKGVKDEAGDPLARFARFKALAGDRLAIFSGGGGRTLFEEMHLGFAGSCPFIGLADLYQQTFDLWQAGQRKEAFDLFGRISAFNSIRGANAYAMVARGVFGETTLYRQNPSKTGAVTSPAAPADAAQKAFIRETLNESLKPYLRG